MQCRGAVQCRGEAEKKRGAESAEVRETCRQWCAGSEEAEARCAGVQRRRCKEVQGEER